MFPALQGHHPGRHRGHAFFQCARDQSRKCKIIHGVNCKQIFSTCRSHLVAPGHSSSFWAGKPIPGRSWSKRAPRNCPPCTNASKPNTIGVSKTNSHWRGIRNEEENHPPLSGGRRCLEIELARLIDSLGSPCDNWAKQIDAPT